EYFTSWRTGGNSQSATGYVFLTDYQVGADGRPVVDAAGHPIPVWVPSATGTRTRIQQWLAYPGSTLDINTLSIYAQDRWQVGNRITADLGLRFEDVKTDATGDIVGADTRTWLPRLGISFDLDGNGQTVAQATYGRYSGRFTERAFARNTNVGTPSRVDLSYIGPAGVGRDFAPGYNLSNYVTTGGNFPTANVFFDSGLTSPKTNEFTLSLGRELRVGYAKVTYTWRETDAFIDDFIDDPTAAGKVTVIRDGVNFGTFDSSTYANTDAPKRQYQAIQFEARADVKRLPVYGHYTVQIKNHGNFEGEAANQPGNPSVWFDYPEMLTEDRYYPYGRLNEFQRHKFRLWTTYIQDLGRFGNLDISPLWRVNSGLTYSLEATGVGMSAVQTARNPGYARANTTTNTLFFGDRGTESFKGYGVLDMAFRYGIPVWKTVEPWFQVQVYNVFNNQKLLQWNTTVTPDPASPLDSIGQPTGYVKGPNFGKATANTHFPQWSSGETGSRTFRMAMGIRF
ncbi:MAG: TonB-dependent receptor domain-containing protein, partial [Vicinamibacterales bacterium]